jgi:hypothetical protein
MAGITDNESDVVITGKIDSSNDLVAGRDIHGVVHVVPEAAGLGLGGERVTTLVGKVGLHHRRRGIKTGGD